MSAAPPMAPAAGAMNLNPAGDAEAIVSAIEQRSGRPLRAMIEIVDRCNEVCVHCYQEQGRKGEMSTEQLEALIDELAEMGVLILTISGGEATLRKDFLRLMRHARARGFVLRLFTNGLTMTAQLAAELYALAVDVVEISLYSHRAEVHDFVTGVPGSFERTVAGIRHLVAAGVSTHVKSPVMRVNEDEIGALMDFAQELGVSYAVDSDALFAREHESQDPAAMSRSEDGIVKVLRDPRMPAMTARPPAQPAERELCGAGRTVHVEPNGDIRPCAVLPMSMGRADQPGGLAASRAVALRDQLAQLSWADAHGCRDCDLQRYCHRCHARSLSEVGDALAPYPSACANARQKYALAHEAPLSPPEGPRQTGPYRLVDGALSLREHRIEARDDELAERFGWVRAPAAPAVAPATAVPGALVQLRRPGRKRAREERVPGLAEGEAADAAQ